MCRGLDSFRGYEVAQKMLMLRNCWSDPGLRNRRKNFFSWRNRDSAEWAGGGLPAADLSWAVPAAGPRNEREAAYLPGCRGYLRFPVGFVAGRRVRCRRPD